MTQDLYTELLGIPPGPRPPNHYAILGLPLFEPDTKVIHEAVLRQTAELKRYVLHPDPDRIRRVQELLNEVHAAGTTLEDPKTKAPHDDRLALQLGIPLPTPELPALRLASEAAAPAQEERVPEPEPAPADLLPESPSPSPELPVAGPRATVALFLRRHRGWALLAAGLLLALSLAFALRPSPSEPRPPDGPPAPPGPEKPKRGIDTGAAKRGKEDDQAPEDAERKRHQAEFHAACQRAEDLVARNHFGEAHAQFEELLGDSPSQDLRLAVLKEKVAIDQRAEQAYDDIHRRAQLKAGAGLYGEAKALYEQVAAMGGCMCQAGGGGYTARRAAAMARGWRHVPLAAAIHGAIARGAMPLVG